MIPSYRALTAGVVVSAGWRRHFLARFPVVPSLDNVAGAIRLRDQHQIAPRTAPRWCRRELRPWASCRCRDECLSYRVIPFEPDRAIEGMAKEPVDMWRRPPSAAWRQLCRFERSRVDRARDKLAGVI